MDITVVAVKSPFDFVTNDGPPPHIEAAPPVHGAQQLLSDASVALTVSLDLGKTIDQVARVIVPALAEWCIIDLLEGDGPERSVRRAAAVHADPAVQAVLDEMSRRFPPHIDRPTASTPVIASGAPLLVPEVPDEMIDQVVGPEQGSLVRRIGVRSYMVVPLRARDRMLGVLALFVSQRCYSRDHLALAEELARRIAMAVDNALLFKQVRESAERLERLQAVTSVLARAVTAEQVAEIVIREAVTALHASEGLLCLTTEDGEWLEIVREVGLPDSTVRDWHRFSVRASLPLSDAVRTGQPVFLENRAAVVTRYPELREANARAIAGAWVALPLMSSGVPIGGLAFGFANARSFPPEERAFAGTLAQQCALALERARLIASDRAARAEAERAAEAEHASRMLAEEARVRADEANRAKMEFLAVMSHELRTPLNAIAGYAELLEIGIHGPLNEAQREAIARIQRSERHLLGLINDVLNFAKLDAGHVRIELGPMPVHEALAALESLVAPQVRAKRLAYRYVPCTPDVTVFADPEKVRQILLNLLSNAIKFSEPDGRVDVSCTVEADVVRLHVSDTGPGIPTDKLERIFEPFVQLQPGRTRTHDGTGLGLAISRDLARAMHGEIAVESSADGGSRFTLTLPRH
jgi:signal transduction histidine kinase